LTIKSTSHITGATFALTLVFVNARQYSVVKDRESIQLSAISFQRTPLSPQAES
jgi:hypothetical protein